MSAFLLWTYRPVGVDLDQWFEAFYPYNWSTHVFLILILTLFALRVLVPWPSNGASRFTEEVLLILPAGLFYFLIRNLVDADPALAFDNAHRIIVLEERLHLNQEPALQRLIIDHPLLINIVNWVYIWGHWPFILGWVLWMWFRHRGTYALYRNAVLVSGAIGMVIFALFPLAPPRFVSEVDVVDTVTLYSRSYRVLQPPSLTNLYAAMPSLHFGWNLLVGIAIVRTALSLPGRLLGIAMPIGMYLAIVLTGNHYIVDGLAGGTVALIGLTFSALVIPLVRTWLKSTPFVSNDNDQLNTPPRGC